MKNVLCYALHETMNKSRNCTDNGRYMDLGNNVFLDMQKSTRNTAVIKDCSSGVLTAVYMHHSKGHGRMVQSIRT